MIRGRDFESAIRRANESRRAAVAEHRQRLVVEAGSLRDRLEMLERTGELAQTIDALLREKEDAARAAAATTERRNRLREVVLREATALRETLLERCRIEIQKRASYIACAEIEEARRELAAELEQLGVGESPSAAELIKAFADLQTLAISRRQQMHQAALRASDRLRQDQHVARSSELEVLITRRNELLGQLTEHGDLTGEPPPLARGITAAEAQVVNAFRLHTLAPLLRDLEAEADLGFAGTDPLMQLGRELTGR